MDVQIPIMSSLMQAIHDSRGFASKESSGLLDSEDNFCCYFKQVSKILPLNLITYL